MLDRGFGNISEVRGKEEETPTRTMFETLSSDMVRVVVQLEAGKRFCGVILIARRSEQDLKICLV